MHILEKQSATNPVKIACPNHMLENNLIHPGELTTSGSWVESDPMPCRNWLKLRV